MRIRFKIGETAWMLHRGNIAGFPIQGVKVTGGNVECYSEMMGYRPQDCLHKTYQQAERALKNEENKKEEGQ